MSDGGANAFYHGPNVSAVVEASNADDGLLTREDFETYTVYQDAPVVCSYRGYTVVSSPPPSSGGATICEMLNILSAYPLSSTATGRRPRCM